MSGVRLELYINIQILTATFMCLCRRVVVMKKIKFNLKSANHPPKKLVKLVKKLTKTDEIILSQLDKKGINKCPQ